MKNILRIFLCLLSIPPTFVFSAETSKPSVEPKGIFLRIRSLKNLQFEAAAQGAPPETVAPTKSMHAANAVFRIRGLPFHQIQIHLPRGRIMMKTKSSGVRRTIGVTQFQSIPKQDQPFRLGLLGFKRVFVGATRERLHAKQAPGRYQGSFNVTVVYH